MTAVKKSTFVLIAGLSTAISSFNAYIGRVPFAVTEAQYHDYSHIQSVFFALPLASQEILITACDTYGAERCLALSQYYCLEYNIKFRRELYTELFSYLTERRQYINADREKYNDAVMRKQFVPAEQRI